MNKDFRNFSKVIEKSATACEASGHNVSDHVVVVNDMINTGKGAMRKRATLSHHLGQVQFFHKLEQLTEWQK